MISSYYDKTADVLRLATVAGYKKAFGPHITGQLCHIQPVQDTFTQDIAGGFGKEFMMFSDLADIVEGDRVVCNSLNYRVVGLSKHAFLGHEHMEIRLRVFETEEAA